MLSARLKVMLADLALTPELAGKMLHVTPRTVRYWISGKTTIPYAAYRLLRILTGAELPCNGWDGWHMHSGKLWSPEGFGFLPKESSWWSLLVRQARSFGVMYDRHRQLDIAIQGMRDGEMEPQADGTGAMRSSAGTLAAAPQITRKQGLTPPSSNTGGKLLRGVSNCPRGACHERLYGPPEPWPDATKAGQQREADQPW